MKFEKILLILLIEFFIVGSASRGYAAGGNSAAAEASLGGYEQSLGTPSGDQAAGALPQWRLSLAEIQKAAAALLATNSKLNEESRGIKQDIDAVNAAIEQVRARNLELARQAEDIRVRNEQNSEAGQVARYKEILAERNDRIRSQGEALEAVKARVRSLENRVSVKGLRVQGLEVERKAQDVDVKVRDEAAVAALRQEVARAREQVSLGQRQRRVLREKTAELNGIENPYVAQIKQTMASNAELKDRVAAFAERRERLSAQLQDLTARRTSVESDKNVKRAVSLLSDRALLERELKDNSVILEQLRQEGAPAVDAAGDLRAADIDKLKAQNAEIEDLLTNLRENVALLEYKITTLERYKGRKGPGRK